MATATAAMSEALWQIMTGERREHDAKRTVVQLPHRQLPSATQTATQLPGQLRHNRYSTVTPSATPSCNSDAKA